MASALTPKEIINIGQIISGYASILFFITGVIGHILIILIFVTIKAFRAHQSVIYATVESIASIGQLAIFMAGSGYTAIYKIDLINISPVWCKGNAILYQTFILVSMSMICFGAFDQFLSTSPFLSLRRKSTIKLAKILTCTAICVWSLHSIPFGYYTKVQPSQDCALYNPLIIRYLTTFSYPILCGLLPIFVSATFGILAFRNVRRIVRRQMAIVRRRLDHQLTAMVLVRVISVVILTSPFFVQRIYWYQVGSKHSGQYQIAIDRLIGLLLSMVFNMNYAVRSFFPQYSSC